VPFARRNALDAATVPATVKPPEGDRRDRRPVPDGKEEPGPVLKADRPLFT